MTDHIKSVGKHKQTKLSTRTFKKKQERNKANEESMVT